MGGPSPLFHGPPLSQTVPLLENPRLQPNFGLLDDSLLRVQLPEPILRMANVPQIPSATTTAAKQVSDSGSQGVPVMSGRLAHQQSETQLPLSTPSDRESLTEYQRLLREQIVVIEASSRDIACSAQGRNRPIVKGQVGLACRHCMAMAPDQRSRGAVYFPAKLEGLYQAGQNMALNHFHEKCPFIPKETRKRLFTLKQEGSSIVGGGKNYWANSAKVLGVLESGDSRLVFDKSHQSGLSRSS